MDAPFMPLRNWLLRLLAGKSPVAINIISDRGCIVLDGTSGAFIDRCEFTTDLDHHAFRLNADTRNVRIGPTMFHQFAPNAPSPFEPGEGEG